MIRYYCDWCGEEANNLYSVTVEVEETTIETLGRLFGFDLSKETAHVCEPCRKKFISEFKRKSTKKEDNSNRCEEESNSEASK